jgi:hypothetical protein
MSTVANIERDVEKLNRDELAAFRRWFEQYDSEAWDRQIEEDALSGKLDKSA